MEARGHSGPPRLALLLLRLALRGEAGEVVIGDLLEEFSSRAGSQSQAASAHAWFWRQALGSSLARVSLRRERASARGSMAGGGGGGFIQDLRFAARALRRRPAFAGLVIVTIAVGVGATTSVFTVANWMLLRPLPGVSAPRDRLALLQIEDARGIETRLSYPNILDLQASAPAVERLVGAAEMSRLQVARVGSEPILLQGQAVTPGYFEALEVGAHRGRLFTEEELAPSADDALVVISYELWRSHLRSDPAAIGRTIAVNGHTFTIIGVAAEGFAGVERVERSDLWFSAGLYWTLRHRPDNSLAARDSRPFSTVVARLTDQATVEAADIQLRDAFGTLVQAHPDANEVHAEHRLALYSGVGTKPRERAQSWQMVGLMFAVATLVLLIASANAANLFLLRVTTRREETSVRRALGASRGQVVRQQLLEVLLLSTAGAGLAMVAISGLVWGSGRVAEVGFPPPDARVFAFALATALIVPFLFALLPALSAGRAGTLTGSGRTATPRRAWLRGSLTVLQLALSLTLLVGSGLLLRTLRQLDRVDPGFDPTGLLAFRVDPAPQGYSDEEAVRFHEQLLERTKALPGVAGATLARLEPFESGRYGSRVVPSGAPEDAARQPAFIENIGADYFTVLDIPLLAGRAFRQDEMTFGAPSGDVVILNETLARALFGSTDAVGRSVTEASRERRVVGVAGDVRMSLRDAPEPILYTPFPTPLPLSGALGTLIVRTPSPTAGIAQAIRAELRSLDPAIPVEASHTVRLTIEREDAEERLLSRLLLVLSVIAGALAAVGLYGVIGWSVAERTREIGLRVALGAAPLGVVRMVTRQALTFASIGIVLGYGASVAMASLLRSLLFGVAPFDPLSWGFAAALLLAVALLAALQPALSATRIHPSDALRHE